MRRLIPTDQGRRFLSAQEGATAIEYAMIASGIAGAIAAAIATLGGQVTNWWVTVYNMFG